MSNIENTNENALTVVTPESDITSLFANIDVAGLNAAITDIANRDTNLSAEEKTFAVDIVNKWELGVVEQLSNENQKVLSFVQYMKNFSNYYGSLINNPEYDMPLAKIIELAGAEAEFEALKDAIEEVNFADNECRAARSNLSESDSASLTKFERHEKKFQLEKELLIKNEEHAKAERKMHRAVSELTSVLNKSNDVKTALNKLTSFARLLAKNKNECAAKANSAKLAIAIDDKDLRNKLQALISISIK